MEHNSIQNIVKAGLETCTFDLIIDYSELSLDSFIDNEIIKEIPVVKSIVGITKGVWKIREMYFAKKLLTFLQQFHANKISEEKRKEFLKRFEDDANYREAVIEQILILNERFLDVEQSKILGNLFLAHVNGKLDWKRFLSTAFCLERLNLSATDFLKELVDFKTALPSHLNENSTFLVLSGAALQWGVSVKITNFGLFLYHYGIKGNMGYELPGT
jgi:hypothetical protein